MLKELIIIAGKENITYIDKSDGCNIFCKIYNKRGIILATMETKVQEVFRKSVKPGARCLF